MGLIVKEVGIKGTKNKYIKLNALIDTGASRNYISTELRSGDTPESLGVLEYGEKVDITFPDGRGITGRMVKLKMLKIFNNFTIPEPEFCMFGMKTYDIILGAKLMQQIRLVLNPADKEIRFE